MWLCECVFRGVSGRWRAMVEGSGPEVRCRELARAKACATVHQPCVHKALSGKPKNRHKAFVPLYMLVWGLGYGIEDPEP